ncbi:hypothetical protein [Gandjariella thermophila]|uniref:Uncharacterized protein n=1 Tax=Gandjariella thermophila TaxID=1931992 RepID=A0A4D4J971_9PSEU|nr:hypothetical protein [Gandjariella thermophila]GDY31218.1 hypothetical protein GTS_28510 [Gandjariella thermophila]
MDVVVEVGDEGFSPPWSEFSPYQTNALSGYSPAGVCGDVDGLVKQLDAGVHITQAQPRQSEVGADNAAQRRPRRRAATHRRTNRGLW